MVRHHYYKLTNIYPKNDFKQNKLPSDKNFNCLCENITSVGQNFNLSIITKHFFSRQASSEYALRFVSSRPSLYNTQIQTEVPIQPNSTKKLGQPSRVSPKIIGSGLPALLQIDQYLPQEGSRDTFPRRHSRKNRNSHSPVLYYHKPSVSTFLG